MNCTVRFYWQHDLDLLALAYHPDFAMSKWVKRAVVAWARGEKDFKIPLPVNAQPQIELNNKVVHFRFDPKSEADVIEKILNIRKGYRNAFFRTVLRSFLIEPNMEPFMESSTYVVRNFAYIDKSGTETQKNPSSSRNKTNGNPWSGNKSVKEEKPEQTDIASENIRNNIKSEKNESLSDNASGLVDSSGKYSPKETKGNIPNRTADVPKQPSHSPVPVSEITDIDDNLDSQKRKDEPDTVNNSTSSTADNSAVSGIRSEGNVFISESSQKATDNTAPSSRQVNEDDYFDSDDDSGFDLFGKLGSMIGEN